MKVRIDEADAPDMFELDVLGSSSLTGDGSVPFADEEFIQLVPLTAPEFAIDIIDE